MSQAEEPELRRAFQAARAAERVRVPPFRRVLTGRPERAPRPKLILGWLALGSAVAFVLLLLLPGRNSPAAELELARSVLSWRSPTAFLLQYLGAELLSATPRLDRAVSGSPLGALDPGGALAPPKLSLPRSSQ